MKNRIQPLSLQIQRIKSVNRYFQLPKNRWKMIVIISINVITYLSVGGGSINALIRGSIDFDIYLVIFFVAVFSKVIFIFVNCWNIAYACLYLIPAGSWVLPLWNTIVMPILIRLGLRR